MTQPTLPISLDLLGNLVVTTPAGHQLRIEPTLAHAQLAHLLMAQRQPDPRIGFGPSPTQWDLSEPLRKATIWAQFHNQDPCDYPGPVVLAPGRPEPKVQKFTPRGKPTLDYSDLEEFL